MKKEIKNMTAFINRTTSGYGVQVYQDHNDPQQFFYVPLRADVVLGDTLHDFKVDYWGVGPAYMVGGGTNITSRFGGILAGRANVDISPYQRRKITAQIENEFGVQSPRLAPLRLRSVKVNPVFADNTLEIGANGDSDWPNSFQFGSDFQYLIGTGNSLFANYVAAQGEGSEPIANPAFGVNIDGKAEFRGEPWKCTVTCDLSSVWSEIRKKISGSARFGWFKIGSASYSQIIKELERKKVIRIEFDSGSLDLEKYGAQIFEMGKAVAEAINTGQGGDFFKFQPNPDEGKLFGIRPTGFLSSLSPWSVSINASYSSESFTQRISFEERLSYVGNFEASVPSAMPLAVICNNATKQHYNDLGSAEPCITPEKVEILQGRLASAVRMRNEKLDEIMNLLKSGQITVDVYNLLKAEIDSRVYEDLSPNSAELITGNPLSAALPGAHYATGVWGSAYRDHIGNVLDGD
ncbi:MAG: hypothetical protein GY906_35520 [bacterium]|nr:hypothetical protein [bacterium]